jgi:hypothetical protein
MDWAKKAKEVIGIVSEFPACDVTAMVALALQGIYAEGLASQDGRYRVTEIELEDYTHQLKDSGARVKGPLGGALVVVYPYDALFHLLHDSARIGAFRERIVQTFRDAGVTEEILIVADNMKFARFERVEDEDEEGKEEAAD